jgi:hypothetical protein
MRERFIGSGLGTALAVALAVSLLGCGDKPEGLALTEPGDGPTVRWNLSAKPLPDLPLPNDIATRPDPTSATGKRVNASIVAPTDFEVSLREKLDRLTGWGTSQPFTISFDKPVDVDTLLDGHRDWLRGDGDYDFSDDVVYLIDVTPGSPTYKEPVPLDFGDGNFPDILRRPDLYFEADPKTATTVLLMETWDEDLNGNGELDPGEDIDLDGRLDKPNVHEMLDGKEGIDPYRDVMTFYEKQTNTLTGRPVVPLLEKTTYAMVITKDLEGENGSSVRSPFDYVNHTEQTDELMPAVDALEDLGRDLDDIAFAWTFTTQAVHDDMVNIRNGLYGAGPMAWLEEDFPPVIAKVDPLQDAIDYYGDPVENLYVIPSDILTQLVAPLASAIFGAEAPEIMEDTHRYVAYHVAGSFTTPYFLDLESEDPRLNGVWPADLTDPSMRDRVEGRTVYFWCVVPRDRYKDDPTKPAPVAVYGHGYSNNRLEHLGGFTTNYTKFGIAGCALDAVDHGIEADAELESIIYNFFAESKLTPAGELLLQSRGSDLDGDGTVDSGDTWFGVDATRTRDSFRQSVLDYMVLIRILRNFDGTSTMPVDVDGDGQDEIGGDFNGDGRVDFGGPDVDYFANGTSLGGIMSALLAAIEPTIVAAAPISGGAGLTALVLKSEQGGVFESFGLQSMGPLWIGAPCMDRCTECVAGCGTNLVCQDACPVDCQSECDGSNVTTIYQLVANGNDDERYTVAHTTEVGPEDIVMATNLDSGKSRCARVLRGDELDPQKLAELPGASNLVDEEYFNKLAVTFRVGLAADPGDPVMIEVLKGENDRDVVEVDIDTLDCVKKDGVKVRKTIDEFEAGSFTYRGEEYSAGDTLVSLEKGLGMKRANPLFRRMTSLAGIAAEPADPVNYAPYYSRYPLEFMEGDEVFERDPVNVLDIVTLGDPAVPVSAGVQIARAAGFFSDGETPNRYLYENHPDYGKTLNRVLVDNRATEAITWLNPFPGYDCDLMDFDNFSESANTDDPDSKDQATDAFDCPRLDPPLRLSTRTFGTQDGISGMSLPLIEAEGAHAFIVGGNSTWEDFDVGMYMSNQIAWYFHSRGTEIKYDRCMQEVGGCAFMPVPLGTFDDVCADGSECYSGECVDGFCTASGG